MSELLFVFPQILFAADGDVLRLNFRRGWTAPLRSIYVH